VTIIKTNWLMIVGVYFQNRKTRLQWLILMSFVWNLWVLFVDRLQFDTARFACSCFVTRRESIPACCTVVYLLVGSSTCFELT
jgi:hypothetical protein